MLPRQVHNLQSWTSLHEVQLRCTCHKAVIQMILISILVLEKSLSAISLFSFGAAIFLEVLCNDANILDWCLPLAGQTGVNAIFSSLIRSSNYVVPSAKVLPRVLSCTYSPHLTAPHLTRTVGLVTTSWTSVMIANNEQRDFGLIFCLIFTATTSGLNSPMGLTFCCFSFPIWPCFLIWTFN